MAGQINPRSLYSFWSTSTHFTLLAVTFGFWITFFRRRSDSIYVRLGVVGDRHLCGCVEEATANFLCRVEPVKMIVPDAEIEGCVVVRRITATSVDSWLA